MRGGGVSMGGVRAQEGHAWWVGPSWRGGACVPPQHYEIWFVNARPVRILLECIL